ncbi:hypothetical protein EBE87_18085, partial [Pseudoroseomonas wenyumeiae]
MGAGVGASSIGAASAPESIAGISGASAFLRERVPVAALRGAFARFTVVSMIVTVSAASGAATGASALALRRVAGLRAAAAFFGAGVAVAADLRAAGLRAVLAEAAFFGAAVVLRAAVAVVFFAAAPRVVVALRAVLAAAFFGA